MRVGKNPYKGEHGKGKAYLPKKTTVCVLTFIPDFSGYYTQRFEVMKVSLASLFSHTAGDFDVLIFDNGSCEEVRSYLTDLHEQGMINYLFLSRDNLGYNGALNFIFNAAPGEFIAYADDDVFYHPGWLEASVTIATTYPNLGYVTACPVKNNIGNHDSSTLSLPEKNTEVEVSAFSWPEAWDEVHASSLGSNVQQYKDRFGKSEVKVFRYKGVEALPISTHFQYLFPRQRREIFLPFKYGNLMSSEINNPDFDMALQLDKKMNEGGYLRLSTTGMLTEHLGNVISPRCKALIEKYKLNTGNVAREREAPAGVFLSTLFKVLNLPGLKNFFRFIHNLSFKILNWKTIYRNR
jgi:glycosyltransferase involved in cell wall biosynthesis